MQGVSTTFSGTSQGNYRQLATAVQISWDKTTASGIQYFTIGQSSIGGSDIIKSTGGGTIALANQYKYTTIPASGIVSWNVSMKLDQFPYGLVQRQAEIVLNNADERLLPASGTALGPYIESGRPIIIQAGFGSETIPMFTGYSDSPVNDYNTRTTTIHAYDAIDYLNSYNSKATTPITNTKADSIIATLLAEAGFAANQYILEGSLNPAIPYLDPFGLMIGDIIGRLCEAEGAIFFADEAGIMHFWNRQHFANNSTPVTSLTYSNMATLQQQNSPIINYVQTESSPMALVSGTQQVYTLDQSYYLGPQGTNATNLITNPSFEISTSGWSGSFARSNNRAQIGAGSWSASGTVMRYDLSSLTNSSSDGIGNTVGVQASIWPGQNPVNIGISGTSVTGQVITGILNATVSGTTWQTAVLYGSHFNLTPSGILQSWSPTTSMPIDALATISASGYMYLAGGASNNTTNQTYYAPMSTPGVNTFSLTSAPLSPRTKGGLISASGTVLAFGGYNGSSPMNSVEFSRPSANGSLPAWQYTTPFSFPRWDFGFASYSGMVYMAGGYTGSGIADVQAGTLTPSGTVSQWQFMRALPLPVYGLRCAIYNGYLYAVGGYNGSVLTGVSYAKINADYTLGTWQTANSLPTGVLYAGVTALQGYLYVIGGQAGATMANNTASVQYAKINADGSLGNWATATSITTAREYNWALNANNYIYTGGGQNTVGSTTTNLTDIQYNSIVNTGVTLIASGTKAFYLDAVSTDYVDTYFDGDSTGNNSFSYAWAGARHNSASTKTAQPNYLTVKCALNAETYSIVQPTASGLNAANIPASTSYYSFSSTPGTGGIYGQDLTSNVSLVNYSVSGTTAFLTFQNNSTQQAYLTNLALYGQTAAPGTGISQYFLDQTSINAYRLNPTNNGQVMTISNDYIPTSLAAQSLAQYLVQGFKTPYLRHSTDVFALPQLQFGDCVRLVNGDTGESRIGYVMGITNSLDSEANLKQSLIIQERNLANYFTIGVSSIGSSSQIAP